MSKDFWLGMFFTALIVMVTAAFTTFFYNETQQNYTPECGLRTYKGTGTDTQTGHELQINVNLPVQCSPTPTSH